ncbi:MAG: acyl-CoA dehydrogenase family protein [Weizmannia coagulans]|jgi:glutaryl-CoA dehydrogenase (non-decarboxylating)|uniref:Acyl-CoA dehydrogenase n=1 Tax=Heyndrickxia coagulans 36D1 TaxID=345219 RepID=G2THA9_HEYCO|nr:MULTISPECIES: acyl-CoA dehydrogenase family protein [Heyndrickxia]MCI1575206.1 acyl-CoA dehydrogenase family protein [Heyndrickxia coagulans]AEP00009.1 acyl-CoA dehydrogenase domain-containing protein [Heyndrickxia coagulans 36D1]MEC2303938.1 acyl-CoA dehydrogenase family protein [Weizmannia sp. CD-2023]MEC2339340.1 acyl-CoA dehydrogenase family protein [Weizmannia sp. CD-2023]MED4974917.1 acyl-CoA dehydrogenase family protein [Weizmannia sp. CD-2023]
MHFELTEEQELLKKTVRNFVDKEIMPFIREWDENHHFETGLLKKLADLGLMGVCIPEKYGGSGMDYNALAIVCEELERGDTAFRTAVSVHTGLNSLTLLQWGTEAQKQKYLVPQAKGEKIGAFGLTEPGAGSDVAGIGTTAEKDGDFYILNGQKTWISLCDVADHFLVFAYTDKAKKHHGISAFIVERTMPGFSSKAIKGKLGIRAGNTGELFFDNVRVPKENLLGEEGEGFKIAMSALDNGRFTVAAGACGLIQACLEASVKYCHERKTFGHEIGKHQLVQQMIAKMEAGYQMSRLLVFRAGELKNQGKRNTRETSLAKWQACDFANEAANDAVQIHGAYGYSSEYPVERYLRNSKAPVIYEGTREIHTIMQAEYVLGYRTDKPLSKMLPAWPFTESGAEES